MNITDKKENNITFPKYINTFQKSLRVLGTIKENLTKDDYKNGKGYIKDDGSVWIYCNKKPFPSTINLYPYFWFNEENKIEFSDPSPLMRNIYQMSSLRDLSVVNIINETKENENFYNEKELLDITSSANFFVPYIKKVDDPWKKLIKMMILEKGIDINRLKSRANPPYQIPNMRTALNGTTKMSVNYFDDWMNLLCCKCEINIKNDGSDKVNPLKYDYTYDVSTDTLYAYINGKKMKVDMQKYYYNPKEDEES